MNERGKIAFFRGIRAGTRTRANLSSSVGKRIFASARTPFSDPEGYPSSHNASSLPRARARHLPATRQGKVHSPSDRELLVASSILTTKGLKAPVPVRAKSFEKLLAPIGRSVKITRGRTLAGIVGVERERYAREFARSIYRSRDQRSRFSNRRSRVRPAREAAAAAHDRERSHVESALRRVYDRRHSRRGEKSARGTRGASSESRPRTVYTRLLRSRRLSRSKVDGGKRKRPTLFSARGYFVATRWNFDRSERARRGNFPYREISDFTRLLVTPMSFRIADNRARPRVCSYFEIQSRRNAYRAYTIVHIGEIERGRSPRREGRENGEKGHAERKRERAGRE